MNSGNYSLTKFLASKFLQQYLIKTDSVDYCLNRIVRIPALTLQAAKKQTEKYHGGKANFPTCADMKLSCNQ